MSLLSDEERSILIEPPAFLSGLSDDLVAKLLAESYVATYPRDSYVTRIGDNPDDVFLVVSGILNVSAGSASGKHITHLLVKAGEPYNLIGPFHDEPRILEVRAAKQTRCLCIKKQGFLRLIENNPPLLHKVIIAIGGAMDSANSRILDLMDKNVEERILRTLLSLYLKFGSPIPFTNQALSEVAGTTTESVIRSMANLKKLGIIETQRGKIWIKDPDALKEVEFGKMII